MAALIPGSVTALPVWRFMTRLGEVKVVFKIFLKHSFFRWLSTGNDSYFFLKLANILLCSNMTCLISSLRSTLINRLKTIRQSEQSHLLLCGLSTCWNEPPSEMCTALKQLCVFCYNHLPLKLTWEAICCLLTWKTTWAGLDLNLPARQICARAHLPIPPAPPLTLFISSIRSQSKKSEPWVIF